MPQEDTVSTASVIRTIRELLSELYPTAVSVTITVTAYSAEITERHHERTDDASWKQLNGEWVE